MHYRDLLDQGRASDPDLNRRSQETLSVFTRLSTDSFLGGNPKHFHYLFTQVPGQTLHNWHFYINHSMDDGDYNLSEKMLETFADVPFGTGSFSSLSATSAMNRERDLSQTLMANVNLNLDGHAEEQSGDSLVDSVYDDSSLNPDTRANHGYPQVRDTLPFIDIAMDVDLSEHDAFDLVEDFERSQTSLASDDTILSLAQRMCNIYESKSHNPLGLEEQVNLGRTEYDLHQAEMISESHSSWQNQSSVYDQFAMPSLPLENNNGSTPLKQPSGETAVLNLQCKDHRTETASPEETFRSPPEQFTARRRFTIPRLNIIRTYSDAAEPSDESNVFHHRSPGISPDRLSAGSPGRWTGSPDSFASSYCSSNPSPESSLTPSPRSSLASPIWPFSEHPSLSPRRSSTESIPDINSTSPSSTDSKRSHILPPCRVCSAAASGFHYGANTCEACKGFFRRSMVRKQEYVCTKSKNCQIDFKVKRKVCAYCRYQKCLEAGMCRTGIKTGRYTYEKRTKDILEVQQLKRDQNKASRQSAMIDRTARVKDIMAEIRMVSEKHRSILDYEPQKAALIKYMEEQELLEETFGSLKPVEQDDFLLTYEQLGIELDNRRDVVDALLKGFERTSFPRLITYIRDFPGFGPLKFSDVLNLLKYHFFDLWFLQCTECISNTGHVTSAFQTIFEIAQIIGVKETDCVLKMIERIKRLRLTLEESILLQAVVLLTSDQSNIEHPEITESLLVTYCDTLQCVLSSSHPDDLQIFPKVMQVVSDLRYISFVTRKGISSTLTSMDSSLYPLMTEIIEGFR